MGATKEEIDTVKLLLFGTEQMLDVELILKWIRAADTQGLSEENIPCGIQFSSYDRTSNYNLCRLLDGNLKSFDSQLRYELLQNSILYTKNYPLIRKLLRYDPLIQYLPRSFWRVRDYRIIKIASRTLREGKMGSYMGVYGESFRSHPEADPVVKLGNELSAIITDIRGYLVHKFGRRGMAHYKRGLRSMSTQRGMYMGIDPKISNRIDQYLQSEENRVSLKSVLDLLDFNDLSVPSRTRNKKVLDAAKTIYLSKRLCLDRGGGRLLEELFSLAISSLNYPLFGFLLRVVTEEHNDTAGTQRGWGAVKFLSDSGILRLLRVNVSTKDRDCKIRLRFLKKIDSILPRYWAYDLSEGESVELIKTGCVKSAMNIPWRHSPEIRENWETINQMREEQVFTHSILKYPLWKITHKLPKWLRIPFMLLVIFPLQVLKRVF